MNAQIWMSRDDAELIVELLERNFASADPVYPPGEGADLAAQIRKKFGMAPQPELVYIAKDDVYG